MKDKKINAIVWGVLLIAIGAGIALKLFGILEIDVFFDGWWTLLIILPCTVGLLTEKDKTGNLVGLAIGVFMLLACQDVLDFGFVAKLIVPALAIIGGIKLLVKALKKDDTHTTDFSCKDGKKQSACAVFSGAELKPYNEVFRGAELTAIFGGVDCDLRNAIIDRDCEIRATAVFGGIDIVLPANVNVEVDSHSLFGGVSAKKKQNEPTNTVTVYINGTGMFGGVEIQ